MEGNITGFAKIFGSGPIGLLISLILLVIAIWVNKQIDFLTISDNQFILNATFLVMSFITVVLIIWSIKSLPASESEQMGSNLYL